MTVSAGASRVVIGVVWTIATSIVAIDVIVVMLVNRINHFLVIYVLRLGLL